MKGHREKKLPHRFFEGEIIIFKGLLDLSSPKDDKTPGVTFQAPLDFKEERIKAIEAISDWIVHDHSLSRDSYQFRDRLFPVVRMREISEAGHDIK